ncbi:MAG: TonB-dependent receptor [Bacteroidetes bacterium]|nr:TonB-dependent receptor [Bacteroidota bacterium]
MKYNGIILFLQARNLMYYGFGINMKYHFSAFFIVIISLSAFASVKTSLSGKITDKKSGEGIPGAAIYIPELKSGAISKIDGSYKIDNLPATKVLVKVSMEGYAAITEIVDLSITTTKDFSLEESVIEKSEVVITGTSKSTEMKKNPVPMVLIDQQYLTQNSSSNIIESLSKVPGLSTLTTGPNVSKPYIHGLGYNRVLTLFDGVRQEGQQWGDEHGIEVDQFLIDKIEVVKGPASLMYGSDALAGAVNLLPANPVPDGIIKGSALGIYGTNNKEAGGSFNLDGNNHGFIWGFRGSHKQATNYQNNYDGRVSGTKFNENDFNGYIGLNKAWGYSHLNFSLFDDVQEIPDGSRDSVTKKFTRQITEEDTVRQIISDEELNSYSIATLHQHIQHYRIYSNSNFIFGKSSLGVNVGFQQNIRREFSHPLAADIAGLYLILNSFTYNIKYSLPEKNGFETTVGINGMFQNNDAGKGTEIIIPSYKSTDFGPFAHVRKTFGKMDVSAGVRYDMRTFQNDSMFTKLNSETGFDMSTSANPNDTTAVKQFNYYKHTFSGVSGSIGATYNFNDKFGIKANVARGYRAPNAAEISAKGVHPGTDFEQLGSPNFKPEFSLQEDLGLFYSSEHISVTLDAFNNNISNYIYDEKLLSANGKDSLFNNNGEFVPVFKFRQTNAQLYGGEFAFDLHPHPFDWLHFENSVSYIYAVNLGGSGAKITADTKYLPLIPPLHTNTELRAEIKKKFKKISGLFLKIGMQHFAEQEHFYSAYGTETYTPAYKLFDAGIGGNITDKKGNTLCTLSIIGNNITNVAYQSNMNRLKYFYTVTNSGYKVPGPTGQLGIFNMGRNITVKLIVPFNLKKEKAEG